MIKNTLISIAFILFATKTYSQTNLVPNPSFEIHDTCPDNVGQFNYVTNWSTLLNSPDYYNTCSSPATAPNSSVPNNFFGYQNPSFGNGYAGFWVYDDATPVYRELMGTSLISPLVIGQKYYVSFKLNLSLNYISNSACDKTGLRFSNIQHTLSNPPLLNNMADVYTTSIITDTTNWNTVFGSFLADSAYGFIEMGNFFDNTHANTSVQWYENGSILSYYYIDDVCISTDSLYSLNYNSINKYSDSEQEIILYPNPSMGKVFINSTTTDEKTEIKVHDIYGNEIKNIKINSDNNIIEFEESGIYFITLSNGLSQTTKKVVINK